MKDKTMSNPNDTKTMRSLIEAANMITNPTTLVRDTWLTEEEVELYESDVPLDKKFMMKGSSFQVRKAIDGKGYTLYAVGRGGSGLRVVGKVASLDKNEVLKAAEEANKKAASDLLSSLGVPSIRKEEVEEAIAEATKGVGNRPMTGVPAGASKEDHEKARKANPFRVGLSKGVPAGAGAKTWSGKTTKLNKFGNYAVVAADENGSALSWANRTQAQNFSDRHNLNGVVEPSAMGRSFYVSVSDISEATRGVAATRAATKAMTAGKVAAIDAAEVIRQPKIIAAIAALDAAKAAYTAAYKAAEDAEVAAYKAASDTRINALLTANEKRKAATDAADKALDAAKDKYDAAVKNLPR